MHRLPSRHICSNFLINLWMGKWPNKFTTSNNNLCRPWMANNSKQCLRLHLVSLAHSHSNNSLWCSNLRCSNLWCSNLSNSNNPCSQASNSKLSLHRTSTNQQLPCNKVSHQILCSSRTLPSLWLKLKDKWDRKIFWFASVERCSLQLKQKMWSTGTHWQLRCRCPTYSCGCLFHSRSMPSIDRTASPTPLCDSASCQSTQFNCLS